MRAVLVVGLAGRIGRMAAEVAVPGQLAGRLNDTSKTDLLIPILLWRRS